MKNIEQLSSSSPELSESIGTEQNPEEEIKEGIKEGKEKHIPLEKLLRHRQETFIRLKEDSDEETLEQLERLQPQFENALDNMIEDIKQLTDNLTLSADAEREARLDIHSQFALLEEVASDTNIPLEKRVEIKKIVEEIHTEIAALHFHELDRVNPEAMKKAIQMAASRQRGGASSYGEVAERLGNSLRQWVEKKVQQTTEYLRSKTSSERLQNILERLGKSPLPGKIAFGATALTIGLFAISRGEAFADVEVTTDTEKGTMTLEKEGQTPITLAPLKEFGNTRYETPIEDATFEHVRTQEYVSPGVNYTIENPEAFQQFVADEAHRLIPHLQEERFLQHPKLQEMTPQEIVLLATRIVEENLTYENAAQKEEPNYDATINERISTMPLDRLLIENKRGVCRHYAALVEKITEQLLGDSGSQNIAISEIGSSDINHAYNILTEVIQENGQRRIRVSFLDATWDDYSGTFYNELEALGGGRIYLDFFRQKIGYQWDQPLFTPEEQQAILEEIIQASRFFDRSWARREMARLLEYQAIFVTKDQAQKKVLFERMKESAQRAGFITKDGARKYIANDELRRAYDALLQQTETIQEKINLLLEYASTFEDSSSGTWKRIAHLYEQDGSLSLAEDSLRHSLEARRTEETHEKDKNYLNTMILYDLLSFYKRHGMEEKVLDIARHGSNAGLPDQRLTEDCTLFEFIMEEQMTERLTPPELQSMIRKIECNLEEMKQLSFPEQQFESLQHEANRIRDEASFLLELQQQ